MKISHFLRSSGGQYFCLSLNILQYLTIGATKPFIEQKMENKKN